MDGGGEKRMVGLSTSEALHRLHRAIKSAQYSRNVREVCNSWIHDAYHHRSGHSPFSWTSAVAVLLEIFAILIFHSYGNESFRLKSMAAEIFFLFLFLFINICIVGLDSFLRHSEMHSKAGILLQSIEECRKRKPWDPGEYSHLHTPQSPCISTQWTYRDNELVNLPCNLLVEGDIILLRPGHVSPGKCKSIDKQLEMPVVMHGGKVFAPIEKRANVILSNPKLRKPTKPAKFIMLETPYTTNFRLALQQSLKRPLTLFERERHTVMSHYMERIIIPAVFVVTVCVGGLHAAYFTSHSSEAIEHLFLYPALSLLPLLPLALPIYWIVLNAYGMARLLAIVDLTKLETEPSNIFEEMEELMPPTITKFISCKKLKPYFFALLFGKKGYLWRSANLLQVLGSITALCCIDKKGILSWPNPTAEKVFFLKPYKSKSSSQDTYLYGMYDEAVPTVPGPEEVKDEVQELKKLAKLSKRSDIKDMYHPNSQVELLDLTHNLNSPFGIQFDDPNWKSYLGNLKPLGLAILLNTCNSESQEHYTCFSDHIACESLYNSAAVPVVNKRCLCELAKQIGFSNSVIHFYEFCKQLGVFRHVHPECVQKGKLARSLNFPRLKMPFPNISCAVVKDLHRGNFQLFSQGTADLILDACNEYWDGEDICVLTDVDKKRILDFYHRSSLTAHCMCYAYGPVNMAISRCFPEAFIELPPEGDDPFSSENVGKPASSWDQHHLQVNDKQYYRNRCLSSDSLILPELNCHGSPSQDATMTCLEQLGNEIFVGMVTMQYQACPDFVQLIEQLDKACIRFVHFSKENELRSRVFSEKMGLESGWNCHISLLSESARTSKSLHENPNSSHLCARRLSPFESGVKRGETTDANVYYPPRCVSAPSIVNLDANAVKLEDEMSSQSKSESVMSPALLSSNVVDVSSHLSLSYSDCGHRNQRSSESSAFNENLHPEGQYNQSHSPSHGSDSSDQNVPVTFDMSNRAKLPKGTENIRPHIENVDNVPLQVSLFTDCTPEATREMICIMQEYGEVVCCLGSSANFQNIPIFLQADASIAIEPLYPQLCVQQHVFELTTKEVTCRGPMDLSCTLNSLPCALSFHREDPISLFHLIMEARHFMSTMRNSFQFMLCCCLSLSLLQMLTVVFFLPLALPLAHMLWFTCLVIPLLSLSLMGNPVDAQVTTVATGKNLKVISRQTFIFFVACYCVKFFPSVLVTIFCFAGIIADVCSEHSSQVSETCWIFMKLSVESSEESTKESWFMGVTVAQNVISFFVLLYFVLISMGFVNRSHLLWNGSPLVNKYWLITIPLVIFLQLVFIAADLSIHATDSIKPLSSFENIPFYVWIVGFIWPVILILVNELIKRHEIKTNVRQQKKARLEFGTKLGMNSPF